MLLKVGGAAIALVVILAFVGALCFASAITYSIWGWKDALGVFFYTIGFMSFLSFIVNVFKGRK